MRQEALEPWRTDTSCGGRWRRVLESAHMCRFRNNLGYWQVRLCKRSFIMNGVIYLIGLVVVVLAVLSFLGLS